MTNPYGMISAAAREIGSDVFEIDLLVQKFRCMTGAGACAVFYDTRRFVRAGAAPLRVQQTLFGKGGVQALDDEAHRNRKHMFLSVLDPAAVTALVAEVEVCWRQQAQEWARQGQVVLYPEMQRVLTRAVCAWAGVPLERSEIEQRTAELTALFDAAGAIGPSHWKARLARKKADAWAAARIERIREQSSSGAATVAERIAHHREADGNLMPARTAGVELLNVLRPTVAISVYLTFIAHALHAHPEHRARIAAGDDDFIPAFVQEVRRFYPFFPAVTARVRETFEWQGFEFPKGRRVLLDLYGINHDPRIWQQPERFEPDRFLGRAVDACVFVPQGGGEAETGHRCAGEQVTIEVMKAGARLLAGMSYDVPPQDLSVEMSRLPALPRSRMILGNVRM